ncbi:MAG: 50S ribosomal protein L30 [Rubrivivax sp.]|uniref:50S ribosomal protein L30 n=1 Tax=Ottowia sp. TaxID=1898956 RepID=UPI0011D4C654|nr:50S ribosomal protein L30 [Ottowia sp.]MCC6814322.1 50S ribosomal protein L30 [Rubrivivax sp.]TXH64863.1 MAG: 50S ribosomal protein L30 [Thermomonas sp.]HNE61093.1 50S ribosomal protein L30 [Ottowia sp.]HNI85801.1 50S ribosomal protein L30 [Ottowia sp.]HNN33806.1 50S ribosomal protein L30 [Ottowia sp.]
MTTEQKTVKVQLVRSPIGCKQSHRDTVRGLGLRKLNSVRELQDTPAVRGMINKIDYLVKIV